jgi:hypothetical protein
MGRAVIPLLGGKRKVRNRSCEQAVGRSAGIELLTSRARSLGKHSNEVDIVGSEVRSPSRPGSLSRLDRGRGAFSTTGAPLAEARPALRVPHRIGAVPVAADRAAHAAELDKEPDADDERRYPEDRGSRKEAR